MVVFTVDFIFISWIFLTVVQIILFIQNKSSNFLLENVDEYVSSNHYLYQLIYIRSVDLSFSSTASGEASEWSVAYRIFRNYCLVHLTVILKKDSLPECTWLHQQELF